MAEQSYLFDFTRTDDFFENFNIRFKLSDMFNVTRYNSDTGEYEYSDNDVGENFTLHIIKYGGDNIEEYLVSDSEYSKLDVDTIGESNILSQPVALDWFNRGYGEGSIELHGNVTYEIGEDNNIPLKAIVLCYGDYVMGYSINMRPFTVTNQLVFDDDVIFWDIRRNKE